MLEQNMTYVECISQKNVHFVLGNDEHCDLYEECNPSTYMEETLPLF